MAKPSRAYQALLLVVLCALGVAAGIGGVFTLHHLGVL